MQKNLPWAGTSPGFYTAIKKTNTYIEGTDYIVTWALGHLVTLADPEQYDEQYKTWNMDTLPMLPEHWKLVVIKTDRPPVPRCQRADFPERCL